MSELALFLACLEQNYKSNPSDFPLISSIDISNFKSRITSISNNEIADDIGSDMLYDHNIMIPLVQSSLAHFLYMKKNRIEFKWSENGDGEQLPEIKPFHPNFVRFRFLDNLTANKATVTLDSFKLYDFSTSTNYMDWDKFKIKLNELVKDPIIKDFVYCFFSTKLQGDGMSSIRILDILVLIKIKKNSDRGLGLLYFILMDLYLEHVDYHIYESINVSGLNCFWGRCLNTAILGFTDKRTAPKLDKILKLDCVLPAWGLTATVCTGTKGGRVFRPWRGKLYINKEGHLQWERPESIKDKK